MLVAVSTQELYPSGHRRVTRYYDVDGGRRDLIYVDWADVVFERARRTGVVTRASLLDRAADNFTATVRYQPDDSPLVTAQTVTLSAGGMGPSPPVIMPRATAGGHKAVLRSVRPSVRLSLPFSDSVPFSRWRCARVADLNVFDRGLNAIVGMDMLLRCAIPRLYSHSYRSK